jgi:hypothetical protein
MAFQPMRQTLIRTRLARRRWFSALADVVTYAVLRTGWGAVRDAIKAARRAPRAQGICVVSLAAAATTDLIKRVFVFMIVSPSIGGVCSLGSICKGFWAGIGREKSSFSVIETPAVRFVTIPPQSV